ncbi:MAG: Gldg family protein, partial [Acetobacteraceae bacterium]
FYSRQLGAAAPSYGTYADHVREMLREYAAASRGKIRLEIYNPEPFSSTEDRALADGLQGVPLDQGGQKVYFGLAGTNLLDDQRTIAFFQPSRERFLEYDLTRLVYELSNPKRPVVGVMSSLPLDGNPQLMMMAMRQGQAGSDLGQPYASTMLLRQTNEVKNVPLTAPVIDPDITVLLVADAQHLSEATQYAIDQFVMRGGRLMVMVDPWSDTLASTPNPSGMPPTDTGSDLHRLFQAWGIQYNPAEVVGDLNGAWQVQTQSGTATDYVAWFNIDKGINHDDPATADLKQVSVATPGFIAKAPGAKIDFTPLLTTDDSAGLIPVASVRMPDPTKILVDFKPAGRPRVIAARIRGVLHSAFSGPPPLAKEETRPANFPAYKAETNGPADLVVVADSDLLADRFWLNRQNFFGQKEVLPFSDNGPFVANLVDTLAGSDALLGLRARGSSSRPFTLVARMQAEAEAKFRKTAQGLQSHLDALQKKLETLRTGSPTGTDESVAAVI